MSIKNAAREINVILANDRTFILRFTTQETQELGTAATFSDLVKQLDAFVNTVPSIAVAPDPDAKVVVN
jgi:hypothetical protein